MSLKYQKDLISSLNWNNIIILDACRYDFFEKIYDEFFSGELIPVISSGSCTLEWLSKTFTKKYDKTYVSSSPYINSQGVSYNDFIPTNHFTKIIDVWNFGWSKKLYTTPPVAINESVKHMTNRSDLIIHYYQPHWPYIGKTKINYPTPRPPTKRSNKSRQSRLFKRLKRKIENYRISLNIPKLKRAYEDNLILVLESVKELFPYLKGGTIITSDHGELLGESNELFHPCNRDDILLKKVPWLTIKGIT